MNESVLNLYHSLPPWTRSAVASARGAYLGFWRYNRRTPKLVEETLERDRWSAEQWKNYQEERLAFVLHRAATKVPYYREVWERRRRNGDKSSWQYLENWEILEKSVLRANPEAFVAEDCRTWRMFAEHTSGTTAKPVTLWRTREVQTEWYALLEARTRHWYGITREDRWGIFGGQRIVPVTDRKPPFWLWNSALHQLYMSSYHLAPDLIGYYLDAIAEHRVTYLLGYTSALYAVAKQILSVGRKDLRMKVVLTNAEPVTDLQRRVISAAFQCPLRETYGSAEIVGAGTECEHGAMHMWPEVGIVKNLPEMDMVENQIENELICTGLLNADMPLIRYRMGDCAQVGAEFATGASCQCGRTLPVIRGLEGRIDDILYTADGRAVGRMDPAFKGSMPIHEAQIVQEELDRIRIRYVPAPGFDERTRRDIVHAIHEFMGKVEVVLEQVPQVPREKNGKFRAVICKVPLSKRRQLKDFETVVKA